MLESASGGMTAPGGLLPGGVYSGQESAPRGVCSGGCLLWGVCSWGGVVLPGGVCSGGCAPGGVCSCGGGVCSGGSGIPACTEADPPVNRMTDRCKNITLATTSLRPVKIQIG